MNATVLLDRDDDPTLVMHRPSAPVTEVMDRRLLPPMSGVMPTAQSYPQPIVRTLAPSIVAPRPPDVTQPARRMRSDLRRYRMLSVGLALALAFVGGVLVAYITRNASTGSASARARTPHETADHALPLETRSTPEVRPAAAPGTGEPLVAPPAIARPSAPRRQASSESTPTRSLDGRDLLSEGLSESAR